MEIKYTGKESNIFSLANLNEGEIYHATDTNKIFIVKDGQLTQLTVDPEAGFQMSLYDMNKQIIAQLPTLNDLELAEKVKLINDFFDKSEYNYAMLLGKEISYYTLFHHNEESFETIGEVAIECLSNLGEIKAIDEAFDNTAIECWVTDVEADNTFCLYMFTYDAGVVEVQ